MKHEVLAIRHVYFEDLGNLELVLGDRGHLVRYLDVGRGRIDAPNPLDPSLMVVLGGPIGAYDEASYPHSRRCCQCWKSASRPGCRPSASASARS